jgi:hypothetical protein
MSLPAVSVEDSAPAKTVFVATVDDPSPTKPVGEVGEVREVGEVGEVRDVGE